MFQILKLDRRGVDARYEKQRAERYVKNVLPIS